MKTETLEGKRNLRGGRGERKRNLRGGRGERKRNLRGGRGERKRNLSGKSLCVGKRQLEEGRET